MLDEKMWKFGVNLLLMLLCKSVQRQACTASLLGENTT